MRWTIAMTLSVLLLLILDDYLNIGWKIFLVAVIYFVLNIRVIADRIADSNDKKRINRKKGDRR